MSDSNKRPLLITFIGILYIIGGVLCALGAVALYMGIDVEGYESLEGIAAGIMIIPAIIYILIGSGFLKGWNIVWYLAVIFGVISTISLIVSLLASFIAIIPLAIQVLLLLYMFRPSVKSFFLD